MLSQQIRRRFLDYFKKEGHEIIRSSPVIPHDDPTLLFINAGMNQFKDVFLGESPRDYTRATSSQKCVRVGGKHNDLENVGHTSRHLTLFEMLGNFSFGDYFKEEAIRFAWEVSTEVFELDAERLWPTVFTTDDEAYEIWKKYVPEDRITRFGESENFWSMGDTGPCGPCSELLYDRGDAFGSARNPTEDFESGERYLEFWNLVFMQFNRDASGTQHPLPKPSIDTGAGLERIVSLKMGVDNVFETDIMRALIAQVESLSGKSYNKETGAPYHVIADHIRCLSFAIADGVQPSNVDRGYVLRKVLRRAVRYGRQLGLNKPFMAQVLPRLLETMGDDFPELVKGQNRIAEILTLEEESFQRTLQRGGNLLSQIVKTAHHHDNRISGDDAFKLKDTYGLPIEEIELLAKDDELTVDLTRYKELEVEAKERSRSAHKTTHQIASENLFEGFVAEKGKTAFVGYHETRAEACTVVGIVVGDQFVEKLESGTEALLILDRTPFYAEMGGQVGDTGSIGNFAVTDCQAPFKGIIAHVGTLSEGSLSVGDTLDAQVDAARRQKIANNHTATHLLHWALHEVVGEHVKQAGSVVDPERLRFDFSHHKALTTEQIRKIEDKINQRIRENRPVESYELAYEEAQKRDDIIQFFGEKYGKSVRVIDIDYSKELCGGTHTSHVGTIGLFRVAKEGSIAAGVRRIEAVTGQEAEAFARESEDLVGSLANTLKTQPVKVEERVEKLLEENKRLQKELKAHAAKERMGKIGSLLENPENLGGVSFVATEVAVPAKELRPFSEELMSRLGSGVLVVASVDEGKVQLLVRVSDDLIGRGIKAGDLVKEIAPLVEGRGGGKADCAQAGGQNPGGIESAFAAARTWLSDHASNTSATQ